MKITILCKNCRAKLIVDQEKAGQQAACPKCKAKITIPTLQQIQQLHRKQPKAKKSLFEDVEELIPNQTSMETADTFAKDLASCFVGNIPPKKPTKFYLFSMLIVAFFMVLLPLIYLGFIGLVGFFVFSHAIYNYSSLQQQSNPGTFFDFISYLLPLICGLIAILFMLKPLFARPAKSPRGRSLTYKSDPKLFVFVEQICEKVGVPVPKRIDVNYDMNAMAGFQYGFWSVFSKDELVLTIGAQLVSGMTLLGFGGVLAHEFGHFSQKTGMRLSYAIRTISHWFQRVVYERDKWDVWLEMAATHIPILSIFFWLTQIFVFCSRVLLFFLMHIGNLVSSILLRQMEYDADYYEAHLSGSAEFGVTSHRFTMIGASNSVALNHLIALMMHGYLMDDITKFTHFFESTMPFEMREILKEHAAKNRTRIFDTHPCDKDRIQAADDLDVPGILHVNGPATQLFSNFERLRKNVTWDLYCEILNQRIDPKHLIPTEKFIKLYEDGGDLSSIIESEELPKLQV